MAKMNPTNMTKGKKVERVPKGVAWYCKKHKTFADTKMIGCAVCGYNGSPTSPQAKKKLKGGV